MSASAALAGFLIGAFIVYVDYAKYDPDTRSPLPGTEYPRLLRNPLEEFGEIEFLRFWDHFKEGHYGIAAYIAHSLAERLYEPREAESLALLAEGYDAWQRFRFDRAYDKLKELQSYLSRFARMGRWPWAAQLQVKLSGHLEVLEKLVSLTNANRKPSFFEEGMPLVLNHLAATERALARGESGLAVLLTYASLERYIDLRLWTEYGLDDERPDYSLLALALDEERFHEVGFQLHGKDYERRDLKGPITLALGIQLLHALNPTEIPKNAFGPLRGLMHDRNKSEFEHGLSPKVIKPENVRKYYETVKLIIKQKFPTLEEELEKYRFEEIS